jgi:hypothetical protein
MVINKLQAALGAVTNEATVVAGAQINLDFTLIKNKAPKKFQALGAFLSPNRKEEAPTPNLVRVYGERVSQTSKQTTDVPLMQLQPLFS